ncbi:DUF4878 domain-containing protein [Clostridium botulinum]|nr:DUF4878 domain-containing protein [Clostridium botulinum]
MNKLKKILPIIVLFALIIGIYGCGTQSPTNVVKSYLEEVKKGENSDFTNLLNDKLDKTEDKGEPTKDDQYSNETTKQLIATMNKITYTVKSEKIDGDSAVVNIDINGPDISKVMSEFMQKAFSTALAQSFSGNEISKEEQNKLFEDILTESIKNTTYVDRTGDISLTKIDGKWKVNNDDSLSTLLIGMKASTFDNKKSDDNKNNDIKEMILNEPFTVDTEHGTYTLTIESATATDKRNEFSEKQVTKVVMLNYTYANESFGTETNQDLYIDEFAFQVLDDEGNVLSTYPVFDENRNPKNTPVGGKCKASVTYGIPADSVNLNVTFCRGSKKVSKIIVPIQ